MPARGDAHYHLKREKENCAGGVLTTANGHTVKTTDSRLLTDPTLVPKNLQSFGM